MKKRLVPALILFALFPGGNSFAQFGPPRVPDAPQDTQTTDIPIDGGLSILLVAGVGYGFKKIREQRKDRINAKK